MSTGGVFKVRRRLKAVGGIAAGAGGDNVTEIKFGVVSACVPSISASATASGSMSISGLDAGAKIIFTGSDVNSGVAVYAAAVAADVVTVGYVNPTGTDTSASTLTFQYIAFS